MGEALGEAGEESAVGLNEDLKKGAGFDFGSGDADFSVSGEGADFKDVAP